MWNSVKDSLPELTINEGWRMESVQVLVKYDSGGYAIAILWQYMDDDYINPDGHNRWAEQGRDAYYVTESVTHWKYIEE